MKGPEAKSNNIHVTKAMLCLLLLMWGGIDEGVPTHAMLLHMR